MGRFIAIILCLVTSHSIAAPPVLYHLEVALLEAGDGLIHAFDCVAGSDLCGGVVAYDARYGGAPVALSFTIQGGCALLQFERNRTHLVTGAGNMQFCLNFTNTGRSEQSFTLYDATPNATEGGVQSLVVTRGALPVDMAYVTIQQATISP